MTFHLQNLLEEPIEIICLSSGNTPDIIRRTGTYAMKSEILAPALQDLKYRNSKNIILWHSKATERNCSSVEGWEGQKWQIRFLLIFPTILLHKEGTYLYLQLFFVVCTQAIWLWWLETYYLNDSKEMGPRKGQGQPLKLIELCSK